MRKILLFLFGMIFLTGTLHAKGLDVVKDVDDLKVKVSMESDPPIKGENDLDIVLVDSEGKPITNGRIKVDYSMPPMGNMPPMIYRTRAKFDGESYNAVINLSMSGQWNINIHIKMLGKSLVKMPFSVKVP